MPFKAPDVKTLDDYKKAMKREAHAIIKDKTKFCIYTDVMLPDAAGKPHPVKPFLVVGSDPIAMTPLLASLKGTKRILCKGTCSVDEGKIGLDPISGKVPYKALKASFFRELLGGKQIMIPTGKEEDEGEEEQEDGKKTPQAVAQGGTAKAAAPEPAKLAKASMDWHGTRTTVDTRIKALKQAVKAHYAQAHPNLIKEIDKSMGKLDGLLGKLDHRLAESLKKASAATTEALRLAELKTAKGILAEYRKYVNSEPLIAHIDSNPFGVKTNLGPALTMSLTQMEQHVAHV